MKILNCTQHPVTIVFELTNPNGEIKQEIAPCGTVPRLSVSSETLGDLDGIPIKRTVFGETQDLPPAEDGTFLIVSALVAGRNPSRNDLLIPNDLVRNEDGAIIGCKSLATVAAFNPQLT